MERVKGVKGEYGLLKEIEGEVEFSETEYTQYGSCLKLRIKEVTQEIWWTEQARMPMSVGIGDTIRGFYEKTSNSGEVIPLEAYEVYKNGRLYNRGSNNHKFIED